MIIALFKGRGFVSNMIRWQTQAKYSHVGYMLTSNTVLEAWPGKGVQIKSLSDTSDIDFYQIDATPAQEADVIAFYMQNMGREYNYWGVFNFITRMKIKKDDTWFCSEILFEALKRSNIHLLNNIESSMVSPLHISISPLLKPFQYSLAH